jgi:hypothetical protein
MVDPSRCVASAPPRAGAHAYVRTRARAGPEEIGKGLVIRYIAGAFQFNGGSLPGP